jgi:hypothetical protein
MRFEILPGLPSSGPPAVYFTERGKFSEGLVIRFYPRDSESWVGNFLGAKLTKYSAALEHPNGSDVIVVAQGEASIVDPDARSIRQYIAGNVENIIRVPSLGSILIQNMIDFIALKSDNTSWRSERISWDGFRNIEVSGTDLLGDAYTPIEDAWVPFKLDLLTGHYPDAVYQREIARAVQLVRRSE